MGEEKEGKRSKDGAEAEAGEEKRRRGNRRFFLVEGKVGNLNKEKL